MSITFGCGAWSPWRKLTSTEVPLKGFWRKGSERELSGGRVNCASQHLAPLAKSHIPQTHDGLPRLHLLLLLLQLLLLLLLLRQLLQRVLPRCLFLRSPPVCLCPFRSRRCARVEIWIGVDASALLASSSSSGRALLSGGGRVGVAVAAIDGRSTGRVVA